MRDSSGFKAPAGHRVKPATDEIQRSIEINDFEEAILEGATLIRVGRALHEGC